MPGFEGDLAADDPTVRARAAAVLGHKGRWAKGTAQALTDLVFLDPAPAVRRAALGALLRRGRLGRATACWEAATGDADADTRRGAAASAPQLARRLRKDATLLAVAEVVEGLTPLLDDGAPLVAEAAAFALGEIVGEELDGEAAADTVRVLARHAEHHSDPLVREACVAGLGALRAADAYGSEDTLPVLLAAARDKPAIRRRAVIALSAFDEPEAEQALREALTDRDWQVRQLAEDLLD